MNNVNDLPRLVTLVCREVQVEEEQEAASREGRGRVPEVTVAE